jgi:2-succinyl-5-enolpyruvyl-6-hydroxy-3-cyclohexene-1-carboxylate synthase
LVLAADENPQLEVFMATDERSAGFFALGAARESNRAVALICTSGTAAANYLPAVAEASLSMVPLVVLTADRPPELRDAGAAQTILQPGMYGGHVRWQAELAVPETDGPSIGYYGATAARAAATAHASPPGPVHLNLPFREPLMPEGPAPALAAGASQAPAVQVAEENVPAAARAALAARLVKARRGVIVCGPRSGDRRFPAAAAALAKALDWPLLADPLSGARDCGRRDANLTENYDLCLRSEAFRSRMRPDLVLRFGGLTSSKPLETWLASSGGAEFVAVAPSRVWPDPSFSTVDLLWGDSTQLAIDLAARVENDAARSKEAEVERWRTAWTDGSAVAGAARDAELANVSEPFEPKIADRLLRALPAGALLHVGNSMPVRDIDTYGGLPEQGVRIDGNRGAHGIDGVLSTAAGAAAVSDVPTYLYVGDLSFLHDLSGLQLIARHRISLTVVVANNDGGGIFELLPQSALGERFERLFATPHGRPLEPAVAMCDGHFDGVADWQALDAALLASRERPGLNVIEVKTDRAADAVRRDDVVRAAVERIDRISEAAA